MEKPKTPQQTFQEMTAHLKQQADQGEHDSEKQPRSP